MFRWIIQLDLRRLERQLGKATESSAQLRLLDLIHARRERLGMERHSDAWSRVRRAPT